MAPDNNQTDNISEFLTLENALAQAFLGTLRVATELTTEVDRHLRRKGAGIKASDWDILALLAIIGPLRPSELVRRSSLSGNANTVTTILNRLEEKGYIGRQPHPEDSRGVMVSITVTGREFFDDLFPVIFNKVVRSFEAELSEQELEMLAEIWSRF